MKSVSYDQERFAGQLILGLTASETYCNPNITFTLVTSKTYWQFQVNAAMVGPYTLKKNYDAIIDSMANNIGVPQTLANDIYTQTNATYDSQYGEYMVPCNSTANLPDVVFTIAGNQIVINAKDYVLNSGYENGKCPNAFVATVGGGFGPSYAFGQTFIKSKFFKIISATFFSFLVKTKIHLLYFWMFCSFHWLLYCYNQKRYSAENSENEKMNNFLNSL